MGVKFQQQINSNKRVYCCACCNTHLSKHEDVISKAFNGRCGRAYLLKSVVNITLGEPEQRKLITGLHTVADIRCNGCDSIVGWKYVYDLFEQEQQVNKVGTFILEKSRLAKEASEQTQWIMI